MEDKESHKPNAVSQEAGQEVRGEEGYEPNTGVGSVHLLHLSKSRLSVLAFLPVGGSFYKTIWSFYLQELS